jgi:Holliday junction resolvase RusA-like endonuclease
VLEFTVTGMPETKGSWRVMMRRGCPSLIPDNEAEPPWAQLVGWACRAKLRNVIDPSTSRFAVRLEFTLPPRKGRKSNRRDLDKLARSILDALTGIVWKDDEQVEDLHLSKRIGDEPGVTVQIEPKHTT